MIHFAALILVLATPATTETPASPVEHRLSAAEIEQVLSEAADKREAAERAADQIGPQIHGEIGIAIGTGGYRSVHGTAAVELPDNGFASFSFEASEFERSGRRAANHNR